MAAKYEVTASDLLKARLTIEQAKMVQKELMNSFTSTKSTTTQSPSSPKLSINCRSNYCDPAHTLRSSTSIQSLLNI